MAINRDEDGRFQEMARALAVQDRPRKTRIADSIDDGFDSLDPDPYLFSRDDDDDYNGDSRMYVRDYSRPSAGTASQAPSFWLPLNDLGDGRVDIRAAAGWLNGQEGTFTRATAATCRLKSGLLKKVASGVPRSHYLASGAYGGYLAEGARTNICLQSETLGTTWASTSNVIGSEATTAPDGTTTADSFTRQAATGTFVSQGFTIGSGVVHTVSMFFKKKDADDWVYLSGSDGTSNGVRSWFNLSTGAVGNTTAFGTGWSGASAVIESWGDGWYRCGFTITPTGTALTIAFASVSANGSLDGTNSAGQYGWGAQLEAATFASSYIPTTTASATRNADSLTFAPSGIVSHSAFTAYVEYAAISTAAAVNGRMFSCRNGGAKLALLFEETGPFISTFDGTNTARGPAYTKTLAKRRLITAGGERSMIIAIDGALGAAQTAVNTFDIDGFGVGCDPSGTNPMFGTLQNARLWQRALPDAQLQSLTA